jgi:hypothetical protein
LWPPVYFYYMVGLGCRFTTVETVGVFLQQYKFVAFVFCLVAWPTAFVFAWHYSRAYGLC